MRMFDFSRPELRVLANSEPEMQRFESSATQNVKSARNRAGSGHFVDMARSPCAEVGSGDAAQVLRRDTGYHTSPWARISLRWSVFLSRPIGTLSGLRTAGRGGEG